MSSLIAMYGASLLSTASASRISYQSCITSLYECATINFDSEYPVVLAVDFLEMRLINTSTIRLEEFLNESTLPRYAILSHTWGNDEVTFHDIERLRCMNKRSSAYLSIVNSGGYYKIAKCCAQALSEELAYAWVDTCCIDKSSSSELSESINSMYRYYANAVVCYAYLDDIDIFDPMRQGHMQHMPLNEERFVHRALDLVDEKDLSKAKWFTRGWTLQELIAPQDVVFYIKGWKLVGSKASMRGKLARITGIDKTTLEKKDIKHVKSLTVARRMSWASNRRTTRVEDMAYSLLGIFDVHMPLIYGEGNRAFTRLQEEIMKDSEDESLFAWFPGESSTIVPLEKSQYVPKTPDINASKKLVDLDYWRASSIYAQHPRDFSQSHLISSKFSDKEPYALTNKGVRMESSLLLLDEPAGIYLLVLGCSQGGRNAPKDNRLGLVIQRMPFLTQYRFVRCAEPGVPNLIRVSSADRQKARRCTIYICKNAPLGWTHTATEHGDRWQYNHDRYA